MEPSASVSAFRQFLARRGQDFEVATLSDMLETVLAFYTTVPAVGLAAEDSDMLLFQFGTYDWGKGAFFEFDITRQFIEAGQEEDDDAISQLHCTFRYTPIAELKALGQSNRWCHSQSDAAALRSFIVSTPAYQVALPLIPVAREIDWSYV